MLEVYKNINIITTGMPNFVWSISLDAKSFNFELWEINITTKRSRNEP